jgi:hypothetical protein
MFQVLRASMKMTVFWNFVPCSLIEIELHCTITLMEAVSTSEISISFYKATQCNIPEDSHVTYSVVFNISLIIFITEEKVKKLKEVSTQTLQIGWKHNLVGFLLIGHIGLQAFLPYSHFITKVS